MTSNKFIFFCFCVFTFWFLPDLKLWISLMKSNSFSIENVIHSKWIDSAGDVESRQTEGGNSHTVEY